MIRHLVVWIAGGAAAAEAVLAAAPDAIAARRVGGSATFRFPADEVAAARDLSRRLRRAGLRAAVFGETRWTPADAGHGRICVLIPPPGPDANESDVLIQGACRSCGSPQVELVGDPRVEFEVTDDTPPAVFTTPSGLLTFLSSDAWTELGSAGLLTGAVTGRTEPHIRGHRYHLLTSGIDLGTPGGRHYGRRCPECDTPLEGVAYFPTFRRPGEEGHVFGRRNLGPAGLHVTEPLARAIGRLVGDRPDAVLPFVGWSPDDDGLAAVPDLDLPSPDDGGDDGD